MNFSVDARTCFNSACSTDVRSTMMMMRFTFAASDDRMASGASEEVVASDGLPSTSWGPFRTRPKEVTDCFVPFS